MFSKLAEIPLWVWTPLHINTSFLTSFTLIFIFNCTNVLTSEVQFFFMERSICCNYKKLTSRYTPCTPKKCCKKSVFAIIAFLLWRFILCWHTYVRHMLMDVVVGMNSKSIKETENGRQFPPSIWFRAPFPTLSIILQIIYMVDVPTHAPCLCIIETRYLKWKPFWDIMFATLHTLFSFTFHLILD